MKFFKFLSNFEKKRVSKPEVKVKRKSDVISVFFLNDLDLDDSSQGSNIIPTYDL